jgi:hypothetical protein
MAMWWLWQWELGHVAGCRYGRGLVGRGHGDRLFREEWSHIGFCLFVYFLVRGGRGETKHDVDVLDIRIFISCYVRASNPPTPRNDITCMPPVDPPFSPP